MKVKRTDNIKLNNMEDRIKCPFCGELIMPTAKKCRFCGEWLVQDAQPNVAPPQSVNVSAPTSNVAPPPSNATPQQPSVTIAPPVPPTPQQPPYTPPTMQTPSNSAYAPVQNGEYTAPTAPNNMGYSDGKTIINSFAEVWPKMLPGRFIHYAAIVWFGAVIMEIMYMAGMGSSSDYYDLVAKSTFYLGMAGYTYVILKNFDGYGLRYDALMLPLIVCMFLKSIFTSIWEVGIMLSGWLTLAEGILMLILALKIRKICQGTIRNIAGWILAFGIMYIPNGIFNIAYSFMDTLWYGFATVKRINYAATLMTGDLIWGILYFIVCLKISKMFRNNENVQLN